MIAGTGEKSGRSFVDFCRKEIHSCVTHKGEMIQGEIPERLMPHIDTHACIVMYSCMYTHVAVVSVASHEKHDFCARMYCEALIAQEKELDQLLVWLPDVLLKQVSVMPYLLEAVLKSAVLDLLFPASSSGYF